MRDEFISPTGTTTRMERVVIDQSNLSDPTLTPQLRDLIRISGRQIEEWRVVSTQKNGTVIVDAIFETEAECDASMDDRRRQNDAFTRLMNRANSNKK